MPLGSNKTIRKMALTRQGEGFLASVDKYGMKAAFRHTRQIYKNGSKPQPPKATLPSRSSALAEAKRILGPDATIPEILEAAKFLTGDQSS